MKTSTKSTSNRNLDAVYAARDALDAAREAWLTSCDELARPFYETRDAKTRAILVEAITANGGWWRPDGRVSCSLSSAIEAWMSRIRGRGRPPKA